MIARDMRAPAEVKNDPDEMEAAIQRDTAENNMNLGEPENVQRTNLTTNFQRNLTLSEAVVQIASSSAEVFHSRMEIAGALSIGREIRAGIYSYKLKDAA